jgi:SAM-dependent methyltransferase
LIIAIGRWLGQAGISDDHMWDERYASEEYVYGTEPNRFLVEAAVRIPGPCVLSLCEGEGRNAVWLAGQGFQVTAVDASRVGLAKASRLADEHSVAIDTRIADLAGFDLGSACWDAIVSIFCHLPPVLRTELHQRVIEALAPGGVFILEAYTPAQLDYGTGGPRSLELLVELEALQRELSGLEFIHACETVREISEGHLHSGPGAVVQVIARKQVGS